MLTFDKSLLLVAAMISSVAWAPTSSTVPDRSGPGSRRDPEPIVALRQGAGYSRAPDYPSQPKTPDYQSQPKSPDHQGQLKSQEERRKLEKELLNGIRTEILRRLGLPYNRTSVRGMEMGSGSDEMANRTLELMRMIEDKEKQQAVKDQLDRKEGKKNNRAILRTILFGEKVANLTDDSVVQFKMNQNSNRDLLVTAATVTVLVRPGRTGSGNQKPEPERLNIKIYALAENDTRSKGDPLTEMTILAKRTRIQRLLLPTSYVQKALDSQESVLRLKIVCDSCGVDDKEVGDSEQSRRSRKKGQPYPRSVPGGQVTKKNRLRARHNVQNTPYLTINSKRKPATSRVRSRMQTARSSGE